jgi:hypothetical protein
MSGDQQPGGCALSEEEAIEIISYLVSSAETSLSEPGLYPIFRLLDATSRMIGLMLEHETPRTGEFLRRFKTEVDLKKVWMMWDSEAFLEFVRRAPAIVAAEAKRLATEDAAVSEEAMA